MKLWIWLTLIISLTVGMVWVTTKLKPSLSQEDEKPACFLLGQAKDSNQSARGIETIGGMIRLNFEVKNISECQEIVISYCYRNILHHGYIPQDMSVKFRSNAIQNTTRKFKMDKNCQLHEIQPD